MLVGEEEEEGDATATLLLPAEGLISSSVEWDWSPNANLATIIGAFQLGTARGTVDITIGSRNTVPPENIYGYPGMLPPNH
jgi:hypothetical protein